MQNQPRPIYSERYVKHFTKFQNFDQLLTTNGSRHYLSGKYLTSLLNPLKKNEFTLKDLFVADNRI